jgi:hypothetical protein
MQQRRRGDTAATENADESDDFDDPEAAEVVYVRD